MKVSTKSTHWAGFCSVNSLKQKATGRHVTLSLPLADHLLHQGDLESDFSTLEMKIDDNRWHVCQTRLDNQNVCHL